MMGIEKKAVHTVISDIAYAPIDRQSVEIKRELAKIFGLHVVVMPSMPGHDAGNISKSNIPTSMTFVRHDGVSHNPAEQADALSIENAAIISHGLLSKLLDVELKAA
jgi:acetylornithine deacetylase/succinyl-diaminopimelate desuccinylase-like protein